MGGVTYRTITRPSECTAPNVAQITMHFSNQRMRPWGRLGPLVLAIDGIEEAQVRNRIPLTLPQSLPDNVVIVATSRQGRLRLPVPAGSRRIIHLRADHEDNRADIRRHIGRLADEFADSLTSVGVSRQEFIKLVADRVGGLRIYLRYIAAAIRSGRRTLDDLGSLPQDLWQYYAETLAGDRQCGDSEPWYRWSLPLLGVLAAVRAPMTAELLGTYAGIPEQWRILDRLENAWLAFLSRVSDESGTATYGVYHASVSDFVNGNVAVGDQTTLGAEAALADELRRAVHDAHERIADHHLAAWGGLAQGLPLLRAGARDSPSGWYGIRHVVQHLECAGRHLDIHVLLRLGAPYGPENAWFACHEDLGTLEDYREHLAIGRRLAVARVDRGEPDRAGYLALEIQYAMMDASLVESASGISHNLLDRLVRAGLWSLEKALFYARRNNDAWGRCQALLALAGHLPDPVPLE